MRHTLRLLASVKPGRYLEPGNPTGLTGLFTHQAPRSSLIYLYSSTLDKLKTLPDSSAYRQSVEALTAHRLKIVEAIEPAGYEQWCEAATAQIAEHPEVFNTPEGGVDHDGGKNKKSVHNGRTFVTTQLPQETDERIEEWDGEKVEEPELEGTRNTKERADQVLLGRERPGSDTKTVEWKPEPPLEATQILDIENQIGGGLIEEVIQVAEGELKLIDTMIEAKVWEELSDKAPPGQWDYFARDQHTPGTQEPPNK
ncbi:hypothetical protein MMC06_005726 [Schaereria dolodes]|nr:hypothetical protein [Schaereria dolodes]